MPLSNTTQEVLRSSPYWDDYNRDKRFHRVLIKPRVPVQTREVNQIQSILQNQVEQVTSSIYREGAAVVGGQQTISNTCVALQVVRNDAVDIHNFYNPETATGAIVQGVTSGAKGIITQVSLQSGEDYAAVIVSKLDATLFVGGESLQFSTIEGGDIIATMVAAPDTPSAPVVKPASTFSVEKGVFFLRGHLVDVPKQTIILSTSQNSPSKRIGFTVSETLVTSADDQSLLDPALGTTNYAAPGADRLKLTATLIAKDVRNDAIAPNADNDFVELIRTLDGVIQPIPERLQQDFIESTLARRTYDESGDYVVSPFQLQVKDHNPPVAVPNITGYLSGNLTSAIITAANTITTLSYANGVTANVTTLFTSEISVGDTLVVNGESRDVVTVSNDTVLIVNAAFSQVFSNTPATIISPNKVNLELSPGIAYVRGYEVRTTGTTKLSADRARTTDSINNGATATAYGPYAIVTLDKGLFNVNTIEQVELHCVPFAGINVNMVNATSGNYAASKIGAARVRGFAYYTGIGDANTTYKMYLVGAEFQTKSLAVTDPANTAASDNVRLGSNSSVAGVTVNAAAKTIVLRQNAASSSGSILAMANNAYVGAIVELQTISGYTLRYPVMASEYAGNSTTLRVQTLTLDSDYQLGTVDTSANVNIIFSDKCIRGMADSNTASKGASVHYLGKVGFNPNANTMMQSPTMTSLLFKYRETPIDPASLGDENYSVLRYVGSVTGNSGTTGVTGFTITANTSAGEIPSVQTNDVWRHMIAVRASNGEVISLTSANAAVDSTTIQLAFANTVVAGGSTLHIYAPMDVSGATPRTKTLYSGNTNLSSVTVNSSGYLASDISIVSPTKQHIAINNITASSNNVVGLGVSDVAAVQKVYAIKDANTIVTNANAVVDVTNRYTLDNGQRDWCYDHASIVLKPGYVHYTTNCSQYLVVIDRFAHSTPSANLGYFNPSSYAGLSLEEIPSFTNPKTGNTVLLANYVDFRPVRQANTAYANTATNPYTSSATTFETTVLPIADGVYRADYDYYLPRIDKLVVTKDKRFQVITGLPSKNPQVPPDTAAGITLYVLNFPAYTVSPEVVAATPFEYKRYTMKDINRLEKRIENLEYYATLSTMDLQSLNNPEFDEYDNERFKNGIVTDMFTNDAVANFASAETKIALDRDNQEMRPIGHAESYKMAVDANSSSNVQGFGQNQQSASSGLVTLTYTNTELTKQPLASKSVNINPFNVFSWRGAVTLLPSSDTWIDTITKPNLIVNLFNANDGIVSGVLESHWNYWSTSTTGAEYVSGSGEAQKNESFDFFVPGRGRIIQQDVTLTTATTTTNFAQQVSTVRDVTYTDTDAGERVIDTSIAPKMRGIDINIAATGLLPASQLRATFDEIDVTSFVERANQLEMTQANAQLFRVGDILSSSSGGRARVVGIGTNTQTGQGVVYVVDASGVFAGTTVSVIGFSNFGNITTDTARSVTNIAVVSYTHWHGHAQTVNTAGGFWTIQLDAGAPTASDPFTGKVIHFTDGGYTSRVDLVQQTEAITGSPVVSNPLYKQTNSQALSGVGGVKATIKSYNAATRTVTLESVPADAVAALTQQKSSYTTSNPIRYSIGLPETSTTGTGITVMPGSFYGMFRVPGYRATAIANERVLSSAVQFNTGTRTFKLTNVSNDTDSQGRQNFVSQGSTVVKQREVLRTRQVSERQVTSAVQTSTITTTSSRTETQTVGYWDPLAQTFIVDKDTYPEGVFATQADLFFAKKGTSNMPVTVQLRRTVNGYPSADEVLASAVVSGDKINVVPEGVTPNVGNTAHYTRFIFDTPEYLATNTEYALVVMSNSNEYEIFVGELGKKLVGSDAIITQQPHGGSFFKSQNARTWVAEPLEDMMFVLHRAEFSTNEGYAVFQLANSDFEKIESTPYDAVNIAMDYLDFDTTRNDTLLTLSTVASDNTVTTQTMVPNRNLSLPTRMKIDEDRAGSLKVRARLRTTNPHVSPVYDVERMGARTIEHYIDNGRLYANGFVFTPGSPNALANANFTNSYAITVSGGSLNSNTVVFANTDASGYVTSIYVANGGYAHTETPTISFSANDDFTIQPTFTYVGETSAQSAVHGERKARYTTRSITLADGFDASDLKVYLSATRAAQHNIEVYYKVLATGDPEAFTQKPWVLMKLASEQAKTYATNDRTAREYAYTTTSNTASYVSNGTTFTRFHTFAIKVVLRSGQVSDPYVADTVNVPRVSNLRVIALDE